MQDRSLCRLQPMAIIGVDIAKDTLVTATFGSDTLLTLANTPAAIRAWLKHVAAGTCIAMESTGRYHLELATQAKAAGLLVYVLNAMDVHHYAKAMGQRGKTDPLDARLIAQYVAHQLIGQASGQGAARQRLRPWEPTPALLGQLRELLKARAQLANSSAKLGMALQHVQPIQDEVKVLLTGFRTLMAQIDAKVAALLSSDAQLAQGCKLMRSIIGVGPQGAALLATLFARMEFANSDSVVAFSGLDPRPQDSGAKRGKRSLSKKGDPYLRRQLYLCAMSATRSALLRPRYEALKARGLPTTAAVVVLARKLLRIAFAVWKSGTPFDPQKLQMDASTA